MEGESIKKAAGKLKTLTKNKAQKKVINKKREGGQESHRIKNPERGPVLSQ